MDFAERLTDKINAIPSLLETCRMGYLGAEESLVIYPMPGSRTITEFMDGTKEQQLNFEIAMKSKLQSKLHNTLWLIQTELEALDSLESQDGSFGFEELLITNKPFINQIDEQGWFVFLLDIQAKITVFKGE